MEIIDGRLTPEERKVLLSDEYAGRRKKSNKVWLAIIPFLLFILGVCFFMFI